ncbi:MAG TPA: transcriptional regulator [Thermococcus paralvinellae]|uniref:Transcriptional regulator n=1 Tax=Thermococcus paralvinellae TaxID=582419 RepID=A0A833E2R5_9EURY|nr:transcriptional regulator [Thermococcus paralvinellae]HIP88549.1 transcriptional regulator [Thermococcus paralvinellae]
MKIRELIEKLNEKQRKTVKRCLQSCEIMDLEEDIDIETNEELLRFLKLVSNPIRYKILKMVKNRWMCVCLISQALGEDQTLISHHLRSLKNMNLLHERREGKLRFYRTNVEKLRKYLKLLEKEYN